MCFLNKFDTTSLSHHLSRHVSSKLADGDVRGALKIITSDGSPAYPSSEVINKIREKHPEPPADYRPMDAPGDDITPVIATEADVRRALNSFPPASSAGLDGIRPAHLRSLTTTSTSEAGARLLRALTALYNAALSGQIPESAVDVFFGASLMALKKKDGRLCPVAIGGTFRHLAGKIAAGRVSAWAASKLRPIQLGVTTRNGCEAAVHAVRSYVCMAEASDQHTVLVKLDVANAFSSIRRDRMLQTIHKELKE